MSADICLSMPRASRSVLSFRVLAADSYEDIVLSREQIPFTHPPTKRSLTFFRREFAGAVRMTSSLLV